jgi:trans-aconitate methyltransferase
MPNNPYPLPNDELEKERLDALQTIFYLLFGTNVVAPINKKPTEIGTRPHLRAMLIAIVDVGTGSGRWVVEVADDYPTAHVVGIDLSPIQPTDVPSNAEFILMDLTQGLEFETGSTDLVQSRYLCQLTSQF